MASDNMRTPSLLTPRAYLADRNMTAFSAQWRTDCDQCRQVSTSILLSVWLRRQSGRGPDKPTHAVKLISTVISFLVKHQGSGLRQECQKICFKCKNCQRRERRTSSVMKHPDEEKHRANTSLPPSPCRLGDVGADRRVCVVVARLACRC